MHWASSCVLASALACLEKYAANFNTERNVPIGREIASVSEKALQKSLLSETIF